jgi:uncharacterized membrane protein
MTIIFYLGAGGLFVLGVLCMWHTSPYTRAGGNTYERRRTRRIAGVLLLIAGAIILGLGALNQFFSGF